MNYSKRLHDIINSVRPSFNLLNEENWNIQKNEQSWSKKQILGHLIDSAYNNHNRLMRVKFESGYHFQSYDQNEWVDLNNYQSRDAYEIFKSFLAIQDHFAFFLEGLDDSLLNQKTTNHNFHKTSMRPVSEREPLNLAYWLEDYIFHVEHHLKQIFPEYPLPVYSVQSFFQMALVVEDYDKAISFYTEKLDFELIEDTKLNEVKRWVIVKPKGIEGGQVLLAKAKNDIERSSIGNQTGGRVFLFMYTDNFERDHQMLIENKVKIVREPVEETWGRVLVFADLYGNMWDLIQLLD